MLFMNEYEIDEAVHRYATNPNYPVLSAAVQTLANLKNWANSISDGWCYWPKPVRAARQLQELIQKRAEPTVAEYTKALTPIKRLLTKHNGPSTVYVTLNRRA